MGLALLEMERPVPALQKRCEKDASGEPRPAVLGERPVTIGESPTCYSVNVTVASPHRLTDVPWGPLTVAPMP